jgi:hypothetical protein
LPMSCPWLAHERRRRVLQPWGGDPCGSGARTPGSSASIRASTPTLGGSDG